MLIENLSLMSLTLKWNFITEISEFVEDKQARAPELIRKKNINVILTWEMNAECSFLPVVSHSQEMYSG